MAAEMEKRLAGIASKLVLTYSRNYLIMIHGNLFLGPRKSTCFWPTLVSNRLECLSLTSFSQSSIIFEQESSTEWRNENVLHLSRLRPCLKTIICKFLAMNKRSILFSRMHSYKVKGLQYLPRDCTIKQYVASFHSVM